MFCFQCQEAASGVACQIKGVCGKEPTLAGLLDVLMHSAKSLAITNNLLRKNNQESKDASYLILDALFSTITNANFDEDAIISKIDNLITVRDNLLKKIKTNENIPPLVDKLINFHIENKNYFSIAHKYRLSLEQIDDCTSLVQMISYGLKGAAAYLIHAKNLGYESEECVEIIENTIEEITIANPSVNRLLDLMMEVGQLGVQSMALLDKANTKSFGSPEATFVNLGVGNNPGILVTGHDLKDLKDLLEQTKESGIDVYTHSEMLPAHYYPEFKQYSHFIGNYGNAWWKQREEFSKFNGPILFTTNCIVPPLEDAVYKDKMFTTGSAGFPGSLHIPEAENGQMKDFSPIIEKAKNCFPPVELESGQIVGGFAHKQVLDLIDPILAAIKSGSIKKFVVMAGCDGRMKKREYYTDFALSLPQETIILTAGCAKYRYNKLVLGDIDGIPRVLDAGQCNDSYSLVKIALGLSQVLNININDLPIVYNIAWYEQKAVIVLLALLSLGIKNIYLGPTLPAFLSENIKNILIDKFNLSTISDIDTDLKQCIN